MMKKGIGAVALLATLVLTPAHALDFPATPINHGAPTNLPGEDIIPGLREALTAVNGVTQPLLQPILAPGGDPTLAASQGQAGAPRHRRRSARRAHPHHRLVAHLRRHHASSHRVG